MNMMTAIIAPPPLLARVELALRDHRITPTDFGKKALNDPRFVFDLRRGRKVRPATERKALALIRTLYGDQEPPLPPAPPVACAPLPPIALLRALPPGPLASAHLERTRQLAELFAAFENDDIELAVDLLIAEYDARQGDPDLEPNGDDEGPGTFSHKAMEGGSQFAEHRDAASALETEDDEASGDEEDGLMSEDDFMKHNADSFGEPGCPISDVGEDDGTSGGDQSWTEWQTRGRRKVDQFGSEIVGRDAHFNLLHEDEEDDDPKEVARIEPIDQRDTGPVADEDLEEEEDRCPAGDDMVQSGPVFRMEADRRLDQRDPGRHARWEPGCEDDAEREQMIGDVPTLPVHSLEHDLFTDKRTYLGKSNLLTSFRSNGGNEVSADTGRTHRLRGNAPFKPGVPA